eukprot:PhM_4_TR8205/c0_g1_i1/m.2769/K08582/CAPN15; calpain-15
MGCKQTKPREQRNQDVPTTKAAGAATAHPPAEPKVAAATPAAAAAPASAPEEKVSIEEPVAETHSQRRSEVITKTPQVPQQQPIVHEQPSVSVEAETPDKKKSSSSAAPSATRFGNGTPAVEGKFTPIFNDGLLFHIEYEENGSPAWAFYNDTKIWEMRVTYKFGPRSTIKAAGKTEMVPDTENAGWHKCTLSVNPGETEKFIVGKPNGYKCNFQSAPVSEEYKDKLRQKSEGKLLGELETVKQLGVPATGDMNELVKVCLSSDTMFVDPQFPPLPESLTRPFDEDNVTSTTWRRPRDYLPEGTDIALVLNEIEPNDIDQGQLGDCWFLSSIAAVAEFPEKIKQLLMHPESVEAEKAERKIGAYRVQLNKHGWWQSITMDSYLPVNANGPCFAMNVQERGELWVSLIEKAYAKLHGSYASIVGGDALDAMQDLTGAPSIRLEKEWLQCAEAPKSAESQAFFNRLVSYDQAGFLVTVSTPGTDDSSYMGGGDSSNSQEFAQRYKAAGLGMGHAYCVLECRQFDNHGVRLMKIRNPWGNGTEWTGAWSDDSDLWEKYPDVKAACNLQKEDDGTFWMTFEDALSYFDGLGVCYLHFGWHDYRVKGKFNAGIPSVMMSIRVKEPTTMYCMMSNPDTRGAEPNTEAARPRATLLHLAEPAGDGETYRLLCNSSRNPEAPGTKWTFSNARDLSMKVTLEPRDEPYLLIANAYDKPNTHKEYVLGLLSEKPLEGCVEFLAPASEMELFLNYPQFTKRASLCESDFQVRVDGKPAVSHRGSSIQ